LFIIQSVLRKTKVRTGFPKRDEEGLPRLLPHSVLEGKIGKPWVLHFIKEGDFMDLQKLSKMIDHTLLRPEATAKDF